MAQRVAILGLGQVGRTLCHQATKVGVRVVALADSSGAVVSDLESGFEGEQLQNLVEQKANGGRMADIVASSDGSLKFVDVADLVDELATASTPIVVADCSATEATIPPLLAASAQGLPIVLANKKPLSEDIDTFDQLRAGREFRHEATVGAGLPVISTLDRQLNAGDVVHTIEGAFSGTLGYIFSGLQEGQAFSDVVRKAKDLGFTEPDPRDDLSGMDVARKALILARMLGSRASIADIEVESLYPADMAGLSVEEFMGRLDELDEGVRAKVLKAQEGGCQLRYAATVADGGNSIKVGMIEASIASNPLAGLSGTDNMVAIHSDFYNQSPLVVQGPGAGLEVTAAGVLSDIVSLRR